MSSYSKNSAMLDIVTHRTTQNDQFDTMINLLREVAVSKPLSIEKAFNVVADKLETKKSDIKDPEVKKLLKKWDKYVEPTMTEPEAKAEGRLIIRPVTTKTIRTTSTQGKSSLGNRQKMGF